MALLAERFEILIYAFLNRSDEAWQVKPSVRLIRKPSPSATSSGLPIEWFSLGIISG
jgi:hypothetical protein